MRTYFVYFSKIMAKIHFFKYRNKNSVICKKKSFLKMLTIFYFCQPLASANGNHFNDDASLFEMKKAAAHRMVKIKPDNNVYLPINNSK